MEDWKEKACKWKMDCSIFGRRMNLHSEHWGADGHKSERQGCDLDTLLEVLSFSIPTVQSISGHIVPAFSGVIVARSGNHGFEVDISSSKRRDARIKMKWKHIILQADRCDKRSICERSESTTLVEQRFATHSHRCVRSHMFNCVERA